MKNNVINASVKIEARPEKVWRVFTDPAVTRQMGGEYVTEWQPGSSFGWKGTDGKMYTQGSILEIEAGKFFRHDLFDPENKQSVISVITYDLQGNDDYTLLSATEELTVPMAEEAYQDAVEQWEAALFAVKGIAESL